MRNTDKGEDGEFCTLLRRIAEGYEPFDALFENSVFKERLRVMISAHRQKPEDAEELANDVRLKVWRSFSGFTPNYAHDYGNFFAWLRKVIRTSFFDTLKKHVEYGDERPEDLNSVDRTVDIERELLYRERLEELKSCINALPERERLATTCHVLEGLPSRITADILTKAGYPCTHVTVLKWVRDGLKPYFPDAEGFSIEEVARKAGKYSDKQSSS
jgi:RNA polymerase sigma factor (sigma-70 family)